MSRVRNKQKNFHWNTAVVVAIEKVPWMKVKISGQKFENRMFT